MSVWVRNSKGRLETFEVFFGSLFDTPTSSLTPSIMAEKREGAVPLEVPKRTMYQAVTPYSELYSFMHHISSKCTSCEDQTRADGHTS